jgi:hypothetical protein
VRALVVVRYLPLAESLFAIRISLLGIDAKKENGPREPVCILQLR